MFNLEADEVIEISAALDLPAEQVSQDSPLKMRLLYGYKLLLLHDPDAKPALTPEQINILFKKLPKPDCK